MKALRVAECALVDLVDQHRNTADGLHLASLAGAWNVIAFGFGGLRHADGKLSLSPQLPAALDHIRFGFHYRGRRIEVTIRPGEACYELLGGEPLTISHHGDDVELTDDGLTLPIPEAPSLERPDQPAGRAPRRSTQHELD